MSTRKLTQISIHPLEDPKRVHRDQIGIASLIELLTSAGAASILNAVMSIEHARIGRKAKLTFCLYL